MKLPANLIEQGVAALEVFGVGIIFGSVAFAIVLFARDCVISPPHWGAAYKRFRANLGRGILLGLEVLVGADIIATVVAPLSFETVGALAIIVLIRTFLSFSLETEIEGRFPWRRHGAPPDCS